MKIEDLMKEIAKDMNKNYLEFEKFINIFKDNWIENVEQLQSLTEGDYKNLNIPYILSKKIIEKLNSGEDKLLKEFLNKYIEENFTKNELYDNLCFISKILSNIINNLGNEKYKKFKASNLKANKAIVKFESMSGLFKIIGFTINKINNENYYEFKGNDFNNLILWNNLIQKLFKNFDKIKKNDPYQTHFNTNNKSLNLNKIQSDDDIINKKYEEYWILKEKLLNKKVENRNIIINEISNNIKSKIDDMALIDENDDSDVKNSVQYLKNICFQEPQFQNKRKKKIMEELKKPIISHIRVKFNLMGKFIIFYTIGVKEKLIEIINLLMNNLRNKEGFYIYKAPPFKELSKDNLIYKTFEELGIVNDCQLHINYRENINLVYPLII